MNAPNRLLALASLAAAGVLAVSCGSSGGGGGGGTTTYAIGGTVGGAWVAGVTVALGGAASASTTTNASGAYSFAGLANGTYTVTPSLAGYTFTPPTATVTVNGADQTQGFASASTVPAHAVSGTVTYGGSKAGRVFLVATSSGGVTRGTSIAGPGAYTIRGLTAGTYVVTARLDALGHGAANAGDPSGFVASVVVGTADVTGADVALTDPPTPTADAPTGLVAFPGPSAMVLFWDVAGSPGTEKATSYELSWGTNSAAANVGTLAGIEARDDPHTIQTGLTDGATLYYKIRSYVGATASAWSSPFGPVTVGAAAGGYPVSGTVSFPGTATGNLYVALQDVITQQLRVVAYGTPSSSPVAFQVAGVPAGRHLVFAILDQNGSHVVDEGDLENTNSLSTTVVDVTAATTGVSVALDAAKAVARTTTHHVSPQTGSNTYLLDDRVTPGVRRPVAVTITSGKNLPLPLDVARQWDFEVWTDLGPTAPAVGDTYTYAVVYDDGSSETLTSVVTGVLDAFATSLTETTSFPYSPGVPNLSWAAPASPPASYGYLVQVWGDAASWTYPDSNQPLPSTVTDVQYNDDGNATPAVLPTGTYTWGVSVLDPSGNAATKLKTYVVP